MSFILESEINRIKDRIRVKKKNIFTLNMSNLFFVSFFRVRYILRYVNRKQNMEIQKKKTPCACTWERKKI